MLLKQDIFELIRNLIHKESGMYFADNKIDFISRRVFKLMLGKEMESPREYYRYISMEYSKKELYELLNSVVTYETYFFRNYPQLRFLAEEILPLVSAANSSHKKIRILSAGCSTGEEPYTLAIILKEMIEFISAWEITIDAFDINDELIAKCKRAQYSSRSVRDIPTKYLTKYFNEKNGEYNVSNEIKQMVNFSKKNIFDTVSMNNNDYYDIVFCRNVLIYFDHKSSQKTMDNFYNLMKPGAFIFLGSSESVGRVSNLFLLKKIGESIAYQK